MDSRVDWASGFPRRNMRRSLVLCSLGRDSINVPRGPGGCVGARFTAIALCGGLLVLNQTPFVVGHPNWIRTSGRRVATYCLSSWLPGGKSSR